jgi:hypothetical protein
MKNEIKGETTERERGRGGIRRRTESHLKLVLIIEHYTLSWLSVHFKSL